MRAYKVTCMMCGGEYDIRSLRKIDSNECPFFRFKLCVKCLKIERKKIGFNLPVDSTNKDVTDVK